MRLLVIGGSGLVGSNIVDIAEEAGEEVYATHHSSGTDKTDFSLDKTDAERTKDVVEKVNPDAVIDTAAFHAVDDCETERERAWAVNAAGTRNAAVAADDVGAHFVYLSTDYVFRGDPEEAPYSEDDPVSPVNYYARTKCAGEQAAMIAESANVLRTSVVYGLASENFLTWVLSELRGGNEIGIVDDQVSTPTYARDLAQACSDIANQGLTGTYHAAGPVSLSRYKFTVKLAEVCGYDSELVSKTKTEELGQVAARPVDSSLDSTRLYDETGIKFQRPDDVVSELC